MSVCLRCLRPLSTRVAADLTSVWRRCWPNQNDTSAAINLAREGEEEVVHVPCSRGPELSDSEGRCSIDLTVAQNPEAAAAPSCGPPPGAESDGCCFRGSENPDRKTGGKLSWFWLPARLRVSLTWRASPSVRHFPSANASGCCGPCADDEQCVGYTFNTADGGNCWLKKAVGECSPGTTCTSAVVAGRHSAPVPPPPPYPGPLTCGYTGKVPPEPLRTKPSECRRNGAAHAFGRGYLTQRLRCGSAV